MYISNEASTNKITYISNTPPKDYFDIVQLDCLIDEYEHKRGTEEVIKYLKSKIKELK